MDDHLSVLSSHKLLTLKKLYLDKFGLALELVDTEGNSLETSEVDKVSRPLCTLLAANPAACARCQQDRRRGIDAAFALGEPYSFVCHAGLLVNCTPLVHGTQRLGALLSGQTLPESFNESLAQEMQQRLQPFGLDQGRLLAALQDHLYVPGQTIQKANAFLFRMVRSFLGLDTRALNEPREQAQQQAQIAEAIQAIKERFKTAAAPYPYEQEKELLHKVKAGDRLGAKAVLNRILGAILFREPERPFLFKIRLVELLALASRAAAEAGVDTDKVLSRNLANIGKLLKCKEHTKLCVIVSRGLNEFLDNVCARREAQVQSPVAAVAEYMAKNFDRPLSVAELARQAHLSPSRASHVFKQKYGVSMLQLLARLRLEEAKKLLLETNLSCLEVALRAGFQEQAYFTRLFRRQEKITPRQYRLVNRGA